MSYNISMKSKGMVYIFTGDGKGKTSAALGVGLRASLSGLKVAMVQWYKDPSWKVSEYGVNQQLKNFTIYPSGQGFFIKDKTAPLTTGQIAIDKTTPTAHLHAADQALLKAQELLPTVDVLILDEINNAISDKLIKLDQVLNLIKQHGSTHLILTGRNAHPKLIAQADLVTSMEKIKHPYDQGKPAVKGLDF